MGSMYAYNVLMEDVLAPSIMTSCTALTETILSS